MCCTRCSPILPVVLTPVPHHPPIPARQAEMLNGRAAMLGFAALIVIEAVRGSALF
jgi:hypothetical protein